ncbi:hypothetical protein [Hydrogenophaga sp.]|uniref:hypothetical protein n=1 Tax=Hydrogenophaga sp. TaxID=1904254 RepID=UPI0035B4E767
MNVRDRRSKIIRWVVVTMGVALLAIPVCAGMLARLVWDRGMDHLVEPLLRVPTATFWSSLLPPDSMTQKPFPPEFYVVVGALVALALCSWRIKHHWRMLTKENEAREMRNL